MTADTEVARRAHPARRIRMPRRGPLEAAAAGVIAAGVVMLMQPFSLTLYGWSFVTTLAGTLLFTVAGRFPE
jgi:hypothetical protein